MRQLTKKYSINFFISRQSEYVDYDNWGDIKNWIELNGRKCIWFKVIVRQ